MTTNTLYFSNNLGIKKINISNLVGESQSVASILLSKTTTPSIPDNYISSLFSQEIGGDIYLIFPCCGLFDGYGCFVFKNETSLNQFKDGYNIFQPQMNNRGILYYINQDENRIEVYYGAHFCSGLRIPDFVYSSTSTPSLLDGDILCLHVVSDVSTEMSTGTRLYVGTTLGMTIVNTYDAESSDGYSAGLDNRGKSMTYSIVDGYGTKEIIGGDVPEVVAISSRESSQVVFVATSDGYGNGGLTQISIINNKKIVFMSEENGLIPSNVVRNIFGENK